MADNPYITLLITDDDTEDREFITDALTEKGFKGNIKYFENGERLLRFLCDEHTPGHHDYVVLLDLNMPIKDGYITLGELKKDHTLKHIPVVVLTSSSRANDRDLCIELGCGRYLQKPLSFREYEILADNILEFAAEKY